MDVIISTIIFWIVSLAIFMMVTRYYDGIKNDENISRVGIVVIRTLAILTFIFQLLCFFNALSAIEKYT